MEDDTGLLGERKGKKVKENAPLQLPCLLKIFFLAPFSMDCYWEGVWTPHDICVLSHNGMSIPWVVIHYTS